jgi:uncharacterized membrane protein YeaQ/YmgE (transglycosylase-associated protein family)
MRKKKTEKKKERTKRQKIPKLIHHLYKRMGIILWIIFGGIVGWIASLIMRTNAQQGPLMDIIIGIIGALVGGGIMSFFGQSGITGFNIYSFLVAILGAIVLIAIVRAFRM